MYSYDAEAFQGDMEQDGFLTRSVPHVDRTRAVVTLAHLLGLPFSRIEGRRTFNWKEGDSHVS